jgi:beta-galactosidase
MGVMMKKITVIAVLIFLSAKLYSQNFTDFALTPPMGWNSWDCYGPTVTEQEVKANADYMSVHLKKYGWEYIVVDIRWYVENDKAHGYNQKDAIIVMDEYGRLMPAVNRFPSSADGKGFKPLADYVHSKGLKFGIHIMRGIPKLAVERNTKVLESNATAKDIYNTERLCAWLGDMYTVDAAKEGAQEYYNSLFKLYASWGIDFVKVDDLSRPYHKEEIEIIRKAIDGCGRQIVLSTSPGETPIENADHVSTHANIWRIIDDFWDNWAQLSEHFSLFEKWIPYMGPGHWPDGDMLPLGRIGIRAERGDNRMSLFTRDEQYTLMSLFAICRSPLMFGGNLPDNDEFTLNLITNEEVLAVLKESKNNRLLFNDGEKIAWAADDLNSDDKYVALFFTSDKKPVIEKNARWNSKIVTYKPGDQSVKVSVDITGAKKLFLVVTDGGDSHHWDHADWIEPKLIWMNPSGTGKNDSLQLTGIKWLNASAGWGSATVNKSVGGNKLIVDNKVYADGIGTHSNSIIEYDLPEGYDIFSAIAGLDKECINHPEGATVKFHVFTQYPTGEPPADSIKIPIKFEQLGFNGTCTVRDLWDKKDIGVYTNEISLYVRQHGTKLLRIRKSEIHQVTGTIYSQQNDWENQKVFRINKEYYHVNVVPYPDFKNSLQMNYTQSPFYKSLNGIWKINYVSNPSEAPTDFFKPEYSIADWKDVKVPFSLENAGFSEFIFLNVVHPFDSRNPPYVGSEFNPVASYRTTFTVPSGWNGREVFLNFDGVESAFYLWINGNKVGYSENSYCPAEFDVTRFIKPGENVLAVQVYRFSDGSYLEDQDFWRLSGIFRDVYLYSVPKVSVNDFTFTTDLDENYVDAEFNLSLKLKNYGGANTNDEYHAEVILLDNSGKEVFKDKTQSLKVSELSNKRIKFSKKVTDPLKWTAETPNLYALSISLKDSKGNPVEYLSAQVGFREVEWKDGVLKVNGRRILIRGVNRHEHDPVSGRYITKESIIKDIKLMKQFNINAVRTCHYTNTPVWYQLCDEYGIYLCAEADLESHQYWGRFSNDSTWLGQFMDRNAGNVEPYKNHASVIYWSLGNESGFGPNHIKMSEWIHQNDPTRPVHYNPAGNDPSVDIVAPMYPSVEAFKAQAKGSNRPVIMCEYAHAMGNSCGNLKEYWEPSYTLPRAQGGFIWDWVDQGIYFKDKNGKTYIANGGELNDPKSETYIAFDGLVLADRTPQPELNEYKYIIQPVKVTLADLNSGKVKIQNRYEFSNLNILDGEWALTENGKQIQKGNLEKIDLDPGMEKEIIIPFKKPELKKHSEYFLNITFKLSDKTSWADRGHIVAWEQLTLLYKVESRSYFAEKDNSFSMNETEDEIIFTGKNFSIGFSKKSGFISSIQNEGKEIIKQGPAAVLYRAPTDNDEMSWNKTSPAVQWRKAGFNHLRYEVKDIKVKKNEDCYNIDVVMKVYSDSIAHILNNSVSYSIFPNGDIFVRSGFEFVMDPANIANKEIPRIGMQMVLPSDFENYKFYGRGPWENYADRNTSAMVGEYTSTVTGQYFPYSRPQHTGNKTNVRWASLTNNDGIGIAVFGFPHLETTALHFSDNDLDKKSFADITKQDDIFFSIDQQQNGLGGGSCGPGVRSDYSLKIKDTGYTFRISLVNKETDISSLMSESPFLAPPVIYPKERFLYKGIQKIDIVPPAEDAEIRFTLDGSEPNESSQLYEEPIQISSDCTIKAKAYKKGINPSLSVSHTYNIGELLFESPVIKFGDKPVACEVSIDGFTSIGILISDPDHSEDWDHADVLEPVLIKKDGSEISLTELKPFMTFQGWNTLAIDKSVQRNPLMVAGTVYKKGLGTHSIGEIWYHLGNDAAKLKLFVGVDDETGGIGSSTITYKIVGIR